MLVEIRCNKFNKKNIEFKKGLNVVLGDSIATNSIGKSSLLMVIDFVFGGESLLTHNTDIVVEIGEHDYYFKLRFDNINHHFRRGTQTPDLLYLCDDKYEETEPISVNDYRTFLKKMYKLEDVELSFRSIVSLFSRIWGKENLDVKQPLKSHSNQASSESIDSLLKLFKRYQTIKTLALSVKSLTEEKAVINKASKQQLIPKSTKTEYKKNIIKVSEIESEIQDIKTNLAKYAVHISELVNRKNLELKQRKDSLLKSHSYTSSRLNRVRNDLSENKHIKSKSFAALIRFFPEADTDRLTEVEEFHSEISKILKSELKDSEKELSETIAEIDNAISEIDDEMARTLSSVENPAIIVDRVHELSKTHSSTTAQIQSFEKVGQVTTDLKDIKKSLEQEKSRILKLVEDIINDKTRKLVNLVYSEHRKSPILALGQKSYNFSAIEDTGTGKAYSNLIIFDLAILTTTSLPFVIHDSVLFKNVQNEAISNLIDLYTEQKKQSFIAMDEIQKYGSKTEQTLLDRKIVQLTDNEVLYIKDWRK